MHIQKRILPNLWLWWISIITVQAAPAMKYYMIDLPNHVLRFSVPEQIAIEMSPVQVEKRLDLSEPGVFKGGFRQIAGHLHDFKGPFWASAYGSLKFNFIVQKKMSEYSDDITTLEGLDRYIHWWNGKITGRATGCVFSRALLNGMPAVKREWNTFGNQSQKEPQNLEIFSLPLNSEMFLDVGFNLIAWEGGEGKESTWKTKAEALREAIKATVVLEPKPPIAP